MPEQKLILAQLSRKQREVLALVADNRTSKEIAAQLGISESAVNQRIETMRSRLGWIPRGELARLYRQAQLDETPDSHALPVTWKKYRFRMTDFRIRFRLRKVYPAYSPMGRTEVRREMETGRN